MSRLPLLGLALFLVVGCGTRPQNASFQLTYQEADKALDEMRAEPRPFDRPVVVVDGFLDPGVGSLVVAHWVRKLTPAADQVIRVNLLSCGDFDSCRRKIVAAVDKAFPTDDPKKTSEVDVIGISMGGLAARYSALPPGAFDDDDGENKRGIAKLLDQPTPAGRQLNIVRLFTLSSPHLGADRADDIPALLATHRDMQTTSSFLKKLNAPEHLPEYPVIPYVRLADVTIGEKNAAPPGQTPIWLPKGLLESAHAGVVVDPRIAADVSRRLRGEESFVTEPRAPLPD